MIWVVLFWLALGYLAYALIAKLIWPRISGKSANFSGNKTLWIGAVIAVVVLGVSIYMKGESTPTVPKWSDQESTQVESLIAARDYYDQAQAITTGRVPTADDWQTVAALLEASIDQGELVSETVLEKIHPRLPEHFQNEFMAGLRAGSNGLNDYNQGSLKPIMRDSTTRSYDDSISVGTELLARWNLWYDSQEAIIRHQLGQE